MIHRFRLCRPLLALVVAGGAGCVLGDPLPSATTSSGSSSSADESVGTTMPQPMTSSAASTSSATSDDTANTTEPTSESTTETTTQTTSAETTDSTSGDADCPNGRLGDDEECDTDDFAGQTCADFGFDGGRLLCGPDCQIDQSECFSLACGDAGPFVDRCPDDCDVCAETPNGDPICVFVPAALDRVICPPGVVCNVACQGQACTGVQVVCNDFSPCQVECNGAGCDGFDVQCGSLSSCSVTCDEASCEDGSIFCGQGPCGTVCNDMVATTVFNCTDSCACLNNGLCQEISDQ